MSDVTSSSYYKDSKCDNGFNPMMIILLLLLCGGDNGLLGGCKDGGSCGCGNGGLDGIMPILLILLLSGGSF